MIRDVPAPAAPGLQRVVVITGGKLRALDAGHSSEYSVVMHVPPVLARAAGLACAAIGIALVFPLMPWHHALVTGLGEWLVDVTGGGNRWWWGAAGLQLVVLAMLCLGALGLPSRTELRDRYGPTAASAGDVPQHRWTGRIAGIVLLAQPAIILGLLVTATFGQPRIGALVMDPGQSLGHMALIRDVLMWVVLTAAVEEWFFRGRLLPWLAIKLGPVSAVSLTTLIFATAHGSLRCLLPFHLAACLAGPVCAARGCTPACWARPATAFWYWPVARWRPCRMSPCYCCSAACGWC